MAEPISLTRLAIALVPVIGLLLWLIFAAAGLSLLIFMRLHRAGERVNQIGIHHEQDERSESNDR